jgi:VWFA-related protein
MVFARNLLEGWIVRRCGSIASSQGDEVKMSKKTAGVLYIIASVFLAVASPAISQDEPGPLPGVFSEVLDVRVVNLEIVVTDKDGVPVFGLSPGVFKLEVDGEEVPIEYFSEVRSGVAAPRRKGSEGPEVAELPAIIPGNPVETSYLVFLDEYFAFDRDRDIVIRSLIEDLPRLGPGDRMAVVAFNGQDLTMLTTWTQSVPKLERVLEAALDRPTYGLNRLAEQRQFDFDEILLRLAGFQDGNVLTTQNYLRTDLTVEERFYLQRLTDNVQRSVTAAMSTLRSFAMPPGRKVMLLFSGGWPYYPATFLGPDLSPVILATDVEEGSALFRPLSDTANLLGYTLYPIDMPGFADILANDLGGQGFTAGIEARDLVPDFTGLGSGLRTTPGNARFLRQQEVQYTLKFLADQTGGEAFIDAERVNAFDRVVSDTRSYYWLGFSPVRDWDDTRHDVRISIREPSFRVRSRKGFLDSSQQYEVAMALESALLFGNPGTADPIKVELGEPRKSGRGKMEQPLSVYFPLESVTFLPGEGRQQVAQLELRVAVKDDMGRRADIPVIPMIIRVDSEPTAGMVGRFDTTLKLRKKPHDAVFAVYDPVSGRILSTSAEITPP